MTRIDPRSTSSLQRDIDPFTSLRLPDDKSRILPLHPGLSVSAELEFARCGQLAKAQDLSQ